MGWDGWPRGGEQPQGLQEPTWWPATAPLSATPNHNVSAASAHELASPAPPPHKPSRSAGRRKGRTVSSLRVTRWKRSGGTHLSGRPASAAASLSMALRASGVGGWRVAAPRHASAWIAAPLHPAGSCLPLPRHLAAPLHPAPPQHRRRTGTARSRQTGPRAAAPGAARPAARRAWRPDTRPPPVPAAARRRRPCPRPPRRPAAAAPPTVGRASVLGEGWRGEGRRV